MNLFNFKIFSFCVNVSTDNHIDILGHLAFLFFFLSHFYFSIFFLLRYFFTYFLFKFCPHDMNDVNKWERN